MKKYDVAVSYARERRDYVDAFVRSLTSLGMRVFYDQDVECQARLLGEDLTVELDNIYRKGSQYCVMFICEHYAKKSWTRYEQRVLRARTFADTKVTVLPCRFDNTELPGLLPTIGFADLTGMAPETLAALIHTKIKGHRSFDFKPYYAMHSQGDYSGAAAYLERIFGKHHAAAMPSKKIWLAYNLACSYSRLAKASGDDATTEKALFYFNLWLKDIAAFGQARYKESLEQFNADDDLLFLRTARKDAIESAVADFLNDWTANRYPTGNNVSSGCFPAGCLVAGPSGERDISSLSIGDEVYSFDLETAKVLTVTVCEVFRHVAREFHRIDGLNATPQQPLYVADRGWVPAAEVQPNDRLLNIDGTCPSCESNEWYQTEPVEVFHLQTDHATHNYFCGGFLVHNKFSGLLMLLSEATDSKKRGD